MAIVGALMVFAAEEPLHAGAGRAVGVVDLPIQREAHNGWPCVFGSGVKGALRARAEELKIDALEAVFGPNSLHAADHAGALMVGDARLLLLPVRSLTGHFKLVTCPASLSRLSRDAVRLGVALSEVAAGSSVADSEALVASGADDLYLEELRLTARVIPLDAVIGELSRLVYGGDESVLRQQLAIVSDDMFAYLAEHATPVAAHVRIDNATKTVAPGALWYEETLSPDTVLYSTVAATASRKREQPLAASEVMAVLASMFADRPYLQLAGNETTGMGWCRVSVITGKDV